MSDEEVQMQEQQAAIAGIGTMVFGKWDATEAVSYTHLTLPTKA